MNVSLRQLRALVALVRTGSFTQAAVSLHVTQSALSSLIKELEQSLGVRLVERSTRSIGLTEAGRGFVPLIDKILQDLDGVLGGIDDLKALRRGVVRVAAPQLMACTLTAGPRDPRRADRANGRQARAPRRPDPIRTRPCDAPAAPAR